MRISRRIMAGTAAAIAVVSAYTAYWFQLRAQAEQSVSDWAERLRADGLAVDYGEVSLRGYPFTLDISIAAPSVINPNPPEPWTWSAERLTLRLLPFKIGEIALSSAGYHAFALALPRSDPGAAPRETALRGSYGTLDAALRIRHGAIETIEIVIAAFDGELWSAARGAFEPIRLNQAQLRLWPDETAGDATAADEPRAIGFALTGSDFFFGGSTLKALGQSLSHLSAEGRIDPIDTTDNGATVLAEPVVERVKAWAATGGKLEVDRFALDWGPLAIRATGRLALDPDHRPIGALTAKVGGYHETIAGLADQAVINPDQAQAVTAALDLLALLSRDNEGRVTVPITFGNGDLRLGPVAVVRLQPLF